MNRLSDSSAPVALAIATSQRRKRVQVVAGACLLGLTVTAPFLYVLKDRDVSASGVSSVLHDGQTGIAKINAPILAKESPLSSQVAESQKTLLPLEAHALRGLKALTLDPEYGEIAARLLNQINAEGGLPAELIEELENKLTEKLAAMDGSLKLAVANNDLPLFEKLSSSRFFNDYAVNQAQQWRWVTDSARSDFAVASKALSSAEIEKNIEAELRALYSIRAISGLDLNSERIAELEVEVTKLEQELLQAEFAQLMAAGKYDELISRAGVLSPDMAKDTHIRDFIAQAEMSLMKQRRDEIFAEVSTQASADNWRAVPGLLSAVPVNLRDQEFQNVQVAAAAIIELEDALLELSRKPDRLADENVQRYAQNLIARAREFGGLSPKLDNSVARIVDGIEVASVAVPLLIESDGRAKILIPGLGYVEPTREKSLWLQKKRYTFIVRCAGEPDIRSEIDLRSASTTSPRAVRLTCGA